MYCRLALNLKCSHSPLFFFFPKAVISIRNHCTQLVSVFTNKNHEELSIWGSVQGYSLSCRAPPTDLRYSVLSPAALTRACLAKLSDSATASVATPRSPKEGVASVSVLVHLSRESRSQCGWLGTGPTFPATWVIGFLCSFQQ